MNGEDIKITDLHRILVGDVPASFYLELVFRAAFIYLLLMVCMRLLGRRMASQLSMTEMTALVSLAAAVGIPMLSPDRGLLPAVVIGIVIVAIGRLSARLGMRSGRTESLIQGALTPLVVDSVLQLPAMRDARVTRERAFAHLRKGGLTHLGKVRRLYLEASGAFTLVPAANPQPGLSIIPDWDQDFVRDQRVVADRPVCGFCGQARASGEVAGRCRNCGHMEWVPAIE
jgi:uncharacterized membrane protein YcaP (DUF421 family)